MVAEQTKAMNKGSLFDLMDEGAAPQPQAQPAAAMPQQPQPAPQYPPQPQRPMAAQAPGGQQGQAAPQQPPMPPRQQPYMGQQPIPQQAPQPAYMGQPENHWQEHVQNPEDMYPHYPDGQNVPTYRPEDYEEHPDFPQSMLENHVSQYQTV